MIVAITLNTLWNIRDIAKRTMIRANLMAWDAFMISLAFFSPEDTAFCTLRPRKKKLRTPITPPKRFPKSTLRSHLPMIRNTDCISMLKTRVTAPTNSVSFLTVGSIFMILPVSLSRQKFLYE